MRDIYQTNAVGTENAGRVLLLQVDRDGASVKVERLDVEDRDLGFVEGRKSLRDEIVSAHGVPPRMLGIAAPGQLGATGEMQGQMEAFREVVIRPRQRLLSGALQGVLDAVTGGGWRLAWRELDTTSVLEDAQAEALRQSATVQLRTPRHSPASLPVGSAESK